MYFYFKPSRRPFWTMNFKDFLKDLLKLRSEKFFYYKKYSDEGDSIEDGIGIFLEEIKYSFYEGSGNVIQLRTIKEDCHQFFQHKTWPRILGAPNSAGYEFKVIIKDKIEYIDVTQITCIGKGSTNEI